MTRFYLLQLARKAADERQSYLDGTVVARFRDEVRSQWNEAHPEEALS